MDAGYPSSACRDLEESFDRAVPEGDPHFTHTTEGADDMPSRIRAALTSTTLSLGEDWDDVPFDTLRARLSVYGDLPAHTAGTDYSWRRTERNTMVQVSCGSEGARCTVAIGRAEG